MQEQTDTQPEAEAVLLALLRQTPVWRKLQLMDQLNQMTRSLAMGDLRQQHPAADERELHRMLAERLFGRDVARQLAERNTESSHAL